MSKIFISYSKLDIDKARAIYDFLFNEGHEVWMDVYNLFPGHDWKLEIQKSIENSDFFIVCLSNNSINKKGFVQKEQKIIAMEVLEQMPEGEIYLTPIRLEECEIPQSLSSKQWLDWFSLDSHSKLLHVIKNSKKKGKRNIEFDMNLLLAIDHIKAYTKVLYPELLKCTQEYINHTEPEISNSTIKKIQTQYFKGIEYI